MWIALLIVARLLALDVLVASNEPPSLFVRSGQIVRVRRDENERPVIDIVRGPELCARLASVCDALRISAASGAVRDCFPSRDVVTNILARGEWRFPPLEGIVEAPVLRSDGGVVSAPDYDPKTRLIYIPAKNLDIPEIPDKPTSLDIAASIDLLHEVIHDFPFVDDASKANALATMFTAVVRPAIKGNTPLGLVDAPQAGTGKGLFCEVVALVATGREGSMMSAPKEEEEWRKRITSVLIDAPSVIIIDNVEYPLASAALASALTAREWSDRILGFSKLVTLPVRATWIANGNNIKVGMDLPRRCYWIRLDAKTARPWERTGFKHPDLLQWISANRGEILAALLTLAGAWFAADKPECKVPVIGGFDEWAQIVGGILKFAGVTGFLANLANLYDTADESAEWEAFLLALSSIFEDKPFTTMDVVEHLQNVRELNEALPDDVAGASEKDGSFHRRLGKAFSKHEGRRYGDEDIHVKRTGTANRAVKWRVVRGG